jgi:hypothetical protein
MEASHYQTLTKSLKKKIINCLTEFRPYTRDLRAIKSFLVFMLYIHVKMFNWKMSFLSFISLLLIRILIDLKLLFKFRSKYFYSNKLLNNY